MWRYPQEIQAFKAKMQPFNGLLSNKTEAQKARLLLLWASAKGLEIYNKAMWEDEADKLKWRYDKKIHLFV